MGGRGGGVWRVAPHGVESILTLCVLVINFSFEVVPGATNVAALMCVVPDLAGNTVMSLALQSPMSDALFSFILLVLW